MGAHDTALIFMEPIFHEKLWGGRKMADIYGYDLPAGAIGECWAISAHPNGDCRVRGGAFDGWHLSELWERHRELFGNAEGEVFPLLVKILDAEDDLSIQVHPDDAYAAAHEGGSLGKRECWYVLDAHEGAHILVGQKTGGREEFEALAAAGRWHDIVNDLPTKAGDFFQVNPGTLHAILGGTLVLETQQSSDVTYRVYDFDRRQEDGTLRELHLDRALDVIDYESTPPCSGAVTAKETDGVTRLVACPTYTVERLRVREGRTLAYAQCHPFLCASVVEGSGAVRCGGDRFELPIGTHFIAPAGTGEMVFSGEMTLIVSHL